MKTIISALMLLSSSAALALAPPVGLGSSAKVARSPATQAGVNGGSSSLTSPTLTLGSGANRASFEWGVDTQPSGDRLEVYWVNSANVESLLWQESGLKTGRAELALPSVAGTGRLRFYYKKDASTNRGLDSVFIDELVVRSATGTTTRYSFDESLTGWVFGSSGFAGSWSLQPELRPLSASRPAAQNGVSGKSAMDRAVIFPTNLNNSISFDYLVDGSSSDKLNVYFDPASNPSPVFTVSGANKRGRAQITQVNGGALPGGPHVIRFEYAKATTGVGPDLARIDELKLMSNGVVFEHHRFDGRNVGVSPIAVGTNAAEWTGSGLGGGWVVTPTLPHRSYVPVQVAGTPLFPGWSPYSAPQIDGRVSAAEYKTATELKVSPKSSAAPAKVWMNASGGVLNLAMRVKGSTVAAGSETGSITVYLDEKHSTALAGQGCGVGKQLPDAGDRKLVVTYSIGAGGTAAVVNVGAQQKGACGSWAALGSDTPWTVTAAATEPATDLGYVHLELSIALSSTVQGEKQLGLAFVRTNTSGTASTEKFPYRDAAGMAADDDVLSWETVKLEYDFGKQVYTDAPFDGCCFPAMDKPDVRW